MGHVTGGRCCFAVEAEEDEAVADTVDDRVDNDDERQVALDSEEDQILDEANMMDDMAELC